MKILNKLAKKDQDSVVKTLSKPILNKTEADPGWKAVVFVINDDDSMDVDLIDIEAWATFNKLYMPEIDHLGIIPIPPLESLHLSQMQPIVSKSYGGNFAHYFEEIKSTISNWNGTVPITSLVGYVHDSENLSYEEVKFRAIETIRHTKDYAKSMMGLVDAFAGKKKLTKEEDDIDSLPELLKPVSDPSKLN